jgi:hypothetical protein
MNVRCLAERGYMAVKVKVSPITSSYRPVELTSVIGREPVFATWHGRWLYGSNVLQYIRQGTSSDLDWNTTYPEALSWGFSVRCLYSTSIRPQPLPFKYFPFYPFIYSPLRSSQTVSVVI